MKQKPKSFWIFYTIIALALAGAAALPLGNFIYMLLIINRGYIYEIPRLFSVSSIIPFMAVLCAMLAGFLFLPLLWKMPMIKRRIIVSAGAVIIFAGLGLFAEAMAARLDSIAIADTGTPAGIHTGGMPHEHIDEPDTPVLFWSSAPSELLESYGFTPAYGRDRVWEAPSEIPPKFVIRTFPTSIPSAFTSRAPRDILEAMGYIPAPGGFAMWVHPNNIPHEYLIPISAIPGGVELWLSNVYLWEQLVAGASMWFDVTSMYIPWQIRLHYYIFSVVLILAVLNFLYSLANTLYGGGKPGKRILILHGVATGCYALAYFFVRAMQYESHTLLLLTWGSVLNAAVCFILAAIAVGLYCGSFMRHEGWGKVIPPISSAFTVLVFYGAQYVMLEGRFYLYSESIVANILLRVLIVAIPGITVYNVFRHLSTYI